MGRSGEVEEEGEGEEVVVERRERMRGKAEWVKNCGSVVVQEWE